MEICSNSFQAIRDTMLSAAPGTRDWRAEPLAALIRHIVSVHHEYLKLELPRIQKGLDVVYATHRERDAATLAPLPEIFFLLRGDLELHMHKEERTLFPAIEESERGARGAGIPPFPFWKVRESDRRHAGRARKRGRFIGPGSQDYEELRDSISCL